MIPAGGHPAVVAFWIGFIWDGPLEDVHKSRAWQWQVLGRDRVAIIATITDWGNDVTYIHSAGLLLFKQACDGILQHPPPLSIDSPPNRPMTMTQGLGHGPYWSSKGKVPFMWVSPPPPNRPPAPDTYLTHWVSRNTRSLVIWGVLWYWKKIQTSRKPGELPDRSTTWKTDSSWEVGVRVDIGTTFKYLDVR